MMGIDSKKMSVLNSHPKYSPEAFEFPLFKTLNTSGVIRRCLYFRVISYTCTCIHVLCLQHYNPCSLLSNLIACLMMIKDDLQVYWAECNLCTSRQGLAHLHNNITVISKLLMRKSHATCCLSTVLFSLFSVLLHVIRVIHSSLFKHQGFFLSRTDVLKDHLVFY